MNIEISLGIETKIKNNIRTGKGKSLLQFPDNYVVFDLETTGLDSNYDEIIEIGALRVRNNKIVEQFTTLIKPEHQIDEFITELTGITNKMVKDAPNISKVLPEFLNFIGNDILVGHNVNFDINFVYDNLIDNGYEQTLSNDFIDTLRLSRRLLKQLNHHRLSDLAEFYNIDIIGSHRSVKDCIITNNVFNCLKEQVLMKYNSFEEFFRTNAKTHHQVKASDIMTTKTDFDEDNLLFDKYIVITGTLEKMSRKEAMQMIADLGGHCEDRVTQKTNFLVLGNNDYNPILRGKKSNKLKDAEKQKLNGNDIEIMSENVFNEIIFEDSNEKPINEIINDINEKIATKEQFNDFELKIYNNVK